MNVQGSSSRGSRVSLFDHLVVLLGCIVGVLVGMAIVQILIVPHIGIAEEDWWLLVKVGLVSGYFPGIGARLVARQSYAWLIGFIVAVTSSSIFAGLLDLILSAGAYV